MKYTVLDLQRVSINTQNTTPVEAPRDRTEKFWIWRFLQLDFGNDIQSANIKKQNSHKDQITIE